MTTASGHRYIVRRDSGADIQSDCPSAICVCECVCNQKQRNSVSDSNRPLVFVCTLYAAPFGRTLCPLPRERVRLARDSLLLSGRPLTSTALPRPVFLVVRYILLSQVYQFTRTYLSVYSKAFIEISSMYYVPSLSRNSFPCAKIRFFQNTQTTFFEVIILNNVIYEVFENF